MKTTLNAPLSKRAPRWGNAFTRWLGRTVLRLGGWKVIGEWPDVDKLLMIAAPHSSAWDGLWGFATKFAVGVNLRILAKSELFSGVGGFFFGPLLRWFGALPTHRHSPQGMVGQTVERFRANDVFWLVLAPEGTRKRVEHWRSGFWHIAHEAGVPVLCAYFHYPEKIIGVGELITLSDDREADMAKIRAYYRPYVGKNRDTL